MNMLNYALAFTNNKGERVLCKNDGIQASLEEKPFYKSKANAEEGIKKVLRNIKSGNAQSRKHWYDKVMNDELNIQSLGEHEEAMRFVNTYENGLLILKNGLEVVEVKISVEI